MARSRSRDHRRGRDAYSRDYSERYRGRDRPRSRSASRDRKRRKEDRVRDERPRDDRPKDDKPKDDKSEKRRKGSLSSDDETVGTRPMKASQKMVDELEDKVDKIENVFDLCQVLGVLQTAAIGDPKFTQEHKASFFMSFIRKATTYYCPQLCEPLLKFIDRYLSCHNIRQIDFVLSKYLEQVQSHPLPDKTRGWFRKVTDGRRKDNLRSNVVTVCPTCGVRPDTGEKASKTPATATPAADEGTISVDVPLPHSPKESVKSEKVLLQEEVKAIMQLVDGRQGPSLADEKRKVKSLFEPHKGRHDDEEEIEAVGLQVSLYCPLSFMRILTPVKGYDCRHIQCFDLESFLITNLGKRRKKKEKDGRERRHGDEWRCPVCNHVLQKQDLYVDKYFLDILNKADASWRTVEIKPDATWGAVTEGTKAKSEFKDIIVIDDDAPELPFDWSTLPSVKVEEVDVEEAADADVDWAKLFNDNPEKWLKKRFPTCHRPLIGVTKEELLLTPKPIMALIFPDFGTGAKLFDELTPYRSAEMTDALNNAQPYYAKFTKKMTTEKPVAGNETEQPIAPATSSPVPPVDAGTTTSTAPAGAAANSAAPNVSPVANDAGDDDEEEAEGGKKRTRGGRKKKKGDQDAAGNAQGAPPKPKPPPTPPAPVSPNTNVTGTEGTAYFPTTHMMHMPGMPFMPFGGLISPYNPMMQMMSQMMPMPMPHMIHTSAPPPIPSSAPAPVPAPVPPSAPNPPPKPAPAPAPPPSMSAPPQSATPAAAAPPPVPPALAVSAAPTDPMRAKLDDELLGDLGMDIGS